MWPCAAGAGDASVADADTPDSSRGPRRLRLKGGRCSKVPRDVRCEQRRHCDARHLDDSCGYLVVMQGALAGLIHVSSRYYKLIVANSFK